MGWFWTIIAIIIFFIVIKKIKNFRGREELGEDNIIRPLFGMTTYEIGYRDLTIKKIRQIKKISLANIQDLRCRSFFGRGTVKFSCRGKDYEMKWVKDPKSVIERINEGTYATQRRMS